MILSIVLTVSALSAYMAANRDNLAGRRFRELNSLTVESDLDKSRNARWHALGAAQRLLVPVLLGLITYYSQGSTSVVYGLIGFSVSASLIFATFDLVFAISNGQDPFYLGKTSAFDIFFSKYGGKIAFLVKLVPFVCSLMLWIFFIK